LTNQIKCDTHENKRGYAQIRGGRRQIMLIKVMYQNNEYGVVKPFLLDDLIDSGKIRKFLRSEGWVTLGMDRVRVSDYGYTGPERRTNSFRELLKWCREEFFTIEK
jgi:hypothetical protein